MPSWGVMGVPFVSTGARTDVGRVRSLNEDSFVAGSHLWVVADGMGGHAAGDVAAHLAIEVLAGVDRSGLSVADIEEAVLLANARIVEHGAAHPAAAGLGTTLAAVAEVVLGDVRHWAIVNVGDSRVYRLDAGRLARATIDHSEVEELVMAGFITEDQARTHPDRNVITRSLGSEPPPQVDVWVLPQTAGERFLICSDGVHGELTDAEIAEALAGRGPQEAVDTLVERALAHGGRDNLTAVLVDVLRSTDEPEDATTNPRPTPEAEEQR